MNKNIINWIVLRYFRSKKKTGLISLTSWISIISIALGSCALLITLSVLNGFEAEIASRIIDIESHIRITGKNITKNDLTEIKSELERKEVEVKSIFPFVARKAIISTGTTDAVVRMKAIDSIALAEQFHNESSIIRGAASYSSLVSDLPGIVLGYRLVDKLGLYIGDTLNIINPLEIGGTFNIPYVGKFVVSGVFKLDLFDYDENSVYIELAEGRRIFEMGESYSGIDIKFPQYRQTKAIKEKLTATLDEKYNINSWEDLHKTLFGAMKLEKYGSFAALCFIILVAIFNLTSSLVMLVMEKIKEIGMLQALGMNSGHLRAIFLRLGMLTGTLGLISGLVISLVLCVLQQTYKFIPLSDVYFISYVPMEVHLLDILLIFGSGLFLILFGTIYPSREVSKLLPLEAIKYEK